MTEKQHKEMSEKNKKTVKSIWTYAHATPGNHQGLHVH